MEADHALTDLQADVMRVLWDRPEATVAEVHATLRENRGLATTTVATLLKRLEKRGLVAHRTEGRQFVYRAAVSEDEVRRSMVSELTERLFEGDATALVSHLLTERSIRSGDIERVKALIEAHERGESGDPTADDAAGSDAPRPGEEDR